MKFVIINGSAESGKDQFVKCIQNNNAMSVKNISTIDPVKAALKCLGWDGEKTPEDRQWMVDTKQRWIQRYNGDGCVNWVEKMYNLYALDWVDFLFVHCREPEEIEKIVKRIPNTITLLIRSPRGKALKNGADDVVENYTYDYVVENDGDLNDLMIKSYEFMLKIRS